MRNYLIALYPSVLFLAAGLYALYCFRWWLGLLISLWVLAGLVFQANANWPLHLFVGHLTPYSLPAYHSISRLAVQENQHPHVVGLPYHPRHLDHGYSQFTNKDFYFTRHGIHLEFLNTVRPDVLENHLRWNAPFERLLWLFYQTSKTDASEVSALDSVLRNLHFRLCDTVEFGIDTVVRRYSWLTLDCQPPQPILAAATQQMDYQFYGSALEAEEERLYFSDKWTSNNAFARFDYSMSYQLISQTGENVAQLDLPLVHQDELRIFYIDFSSVPPGSYRLKAILYERETGAREPWLDNESGPTEMLLLTEVQIP